MRHWTIVQGGLFAGVILALAATAGGRLVPLHLPDADLLNGKLAQAFENHYDKVFPVKTFGTNLWGALEYLAFHEGRPGVVVGHQDWLYTAEEFRTYPDAQASVTSHLQLMQWVASQLAARDARLVVALVPAKARIYPEHLPDRRPATIHRALYGRALAHMRGAGMQAPDLQQALLQCKERGLVFMRTDTHWSPEGARCTALAVREAVTAAGWETRMPVSFRTYVDGAAAFRGDLVRFLPLDPYFESLLPAPERLEQTRTALLADAESALLDEVPAPEVVLVGTSYSADSRWNFTGALQDALREDVLNFASEGRGPFLPMLEYLHSDNLARDRPRLVIWEVPERYLPMGEDLANPAIPAAFRRASAPPARTTVEGAHASPHLEDVR